MTKWKKLMFLGAGVMFIAAVSFVVTISFLVCPHFGRYLVKVVLHKTDNVDLDPQTQFQLIMSSAERGPKGLTIDGYTYRSTDCINVFTGSYEFNSVPDAEEDVRHKIESAYHVYDHTTQSEVSDNVTLERATVKFTRKGEYFILLRRGRSINEIASESLPYALLFERQHGRRERFVPQPH